MSPCIDSRKGFQAERFLFRMGLPTYVMAVPLVVNRRYVNMSSSNGVASAEERDIVDTSVRDLWLAGRKQVQFINELLSEKVSLPSFAKIGCSDFLL